MAGDTVDVSVIRNSLGHYAVRLQNRSDGTGETAIHKVDISALYNAAGITCTWTVLERIDYAVQGFNYVLLEWDHTSPDEIATLSGSGMIDVTYEGGQADPKSSGGTGDVLLTTNGGAAGSSYDITLRLLLR